MAGTVITFYSYKGGVGRSFALANVAVILAQWGFRVLAIDWDIEAPGLHHYFAPHVSDMPAGVLNFLKDCERGAPQPWDAYAHPVRVPDCRGEIFLMPASATSGDDYTDLVQTLDWDKLFSEHNLGEKLEEHRAAWVENFDFVLIDSRTGVTDFSGITTAQLPDVLAFLFTANRQSLDGCCDVVRRAMEARRKLPIDRPALVPLPIVAKFEQREEYDRAQLWRAQFTEQLVEFFDVWAPKSVETSRLIDLLTLPYVPRWTFGEDLAAVLEPRDPEGARTTSSPISYPLETLAALLANGFNKVDLLSSSRDEYVLTARTSARQRNIPQDAQRHVFVSYSQPDREIARQISDIFRQHGLAVAAIEDHLRPGLSFAEAVDSLLDRADAFVALVSEEWSQSTQARREAEEFLRRSLRSDARKPVIPLILPGGATALQSSRLSDFAGIQIDPRRPLDKQLALVFQRLSGAPAVVPALPTSKVVYVLCDSRDASFAADIARALATMDVNVFLPLRTGSAPELRQDIEDSLMDCDAALICWGAATENWLRAALRQLRRAQALRTKALDWSALIVGPPLVDGKKAYLARAPAVGVVLDWTKPGAIKDDLLTLERLVHS